METPQPHPSTHRRLSWLPILGIALALAGAVLVPLSLQRDLSSHHHDHEELLARLTPESAALVEEAQAHEDANPWHHAIEFGALFLIAGLGTLFVTERARSRALAAELRREQRGDLPGAGSVAGAGA